MNGIHTTGYVDQGWTGRLNLPGGPHEMVHQLWILPGPIPGKVKKY